MMATLRLALYYFVLYRAQRWLLAIGAGILVLGLAMGKMDRATAVAMLLIQGLAVPLAALTFRELSMRQSASLAPHFRSRMLASLLVFAGVLAVAAAVFVTGRTATEVPFPARLAVEFAVGSLAVLGIARLPLSPGWWVVGAAHFYAFVLLKVVKGYPWLMRTGTDPVLPAIGVSVLAWAAFASWYLTTPAIGRTPIMWPSFTSPFASRALSARVDVTPERAAGLLLGGGVVMKWRYWLMMGGLFVCLMWLVSLWRSTGFGQLTLTLCNTVTASVASAAVMDAQRARMLWLTSGSRAEIFRLCERRSLGQCAGFTGALALLFAYVWVTGLVGLAAAIWGVALGASLACAVVYLGLSFVTGRHPLLLVLTCAVIVSWLAGNIVAITVLRDGAAPEWLALPLVALAAEGLVCRAIARRRWERIDWLRQRPIRWLTPPSPRVRFGR